MMFGKIRRNQDDKSLEKTFIYMDGRENLYLVH